MGRFLYHRKIIILRHELIAFCYVMVFIALCNSQHSPARHFRASEQEQSQDFHAGVFNSQAYALSTMKRILGCQEE